MTITQKHIGTTLIFIGLATVIIGAYYLGRHDGLEVMRKGDSGLGGLAEWGGSWVLIAGGTCTIGIGLLMKSDRLNDHNTNE